MCRQSGTGWNGSDATAERTRQCRFEEGHFELVRGVGQVWVPVTHGRLPEPVRQGVTGGSPGIEYDRFR